MNLSPCAADGAAGGDVIMDSHHGDGATDCDSVGDSGYDGISGSGCDNGRRGDGGDGKGDDNGFDCDADGNDEGVVMVVAVAE